jgi:hypothetical protein
MIYISQEKWNKEWDNGLTMKLFIEFLKKHNCVQNFYGYMTTYRRDLFSYPNCSNIGRMFIKFGKSIEEDKKNGDIICLKHLQLSQLWKFYLLERLEKFPENNRKTIKLHLEEQIERNGIRNSQEIKGLFVKYGLVTRKSGHFLI